MNQLTLTLNVTYDVDFDDNEPFVGLIFSTDDNLFGYDYIWIYRIQL